MLKGNPSYIFTLIQKFNDDTETPITPDHDIIILSDEAHRSQNGICADNMVRLLPTASRLGFTGTPLFKYDNITDYLKEKLAEHPDKHLLWGTANVFGHQRYMNGAATNPDFDVVARAAVQIKNAIDATIKLGGTNYVFWGGREGYMSLLNASHGT